MGKCPSWASREADKSARSRFVFLGSSAYWQEHLAKHQVTVQESTLFDRPTLELHDQHDLSLALVEAEESAETPAILGFHGAVLLSAQPEATIQTLADDLGLDIFNQTNKSTHLHTGYPRS